MLQQFTSPFYFLSSSFHKLFGMKSDSTSTSPSRFAPTRLCLGPLCGGGCQSQKWIRSVERILNCPAIRAAAAVTVAAAVASRSLSTQQQHPYDFCTWLRRGVGMPLRVAVVVFSALLFIILITRFAAYGRLCFARPCFTLPAATLAALIFKICMYVYVFMRLLRTRHLCCCSF